MYDLFISHASEDKKELVKPLVLFLRQKGVRVWYDEFELKLGDSLSQSIDKGLKESQYGVIVLSKSFFNKGWPEYELQSLITKAIGESKTILPIWHKICQEDIKNYSLFLADKVGLSSDLSIEKLGMKIMEIVRPDIINSNNLMVISRELEKNRRVKLINYP